MINYERVNLMSTALAVCTPVPFPTTTEQVIGGDDERSFFTIPPLIATSNFLADDFDILPTVSMLPCMQFLGYWS